MERVYKRGGILFKILPCLLIAMYAVMCLYGSTVCAASSLPLAEDFSFDYDKKSLIYQGNSYRINNEILSFKYVVILPSVSSSANSSNIGHIQFFVSDIPLVVESSNYINALGDKLYTIRVNSDLDTDYLYEYSFFLGYINDIPNIKSQLSNLSSLSLSSFAKEKGLGSQVAERAYFSSYDLKDKEGNVVFQGASQEALATIIRPQVEGIQLQEILQEIIQILPVILVVIVALIAIRKAIHLLLRVLRNS